MPCVGSMVTRGGLLANSARSGSSVDRFAKRETFDVMTVASSSKVYAINWVGSKGAETKSLNLCANDAFSPNRHMGPRPPPNIACFWGNCVLCCPFVQGPYAE
jgi:hypothetical protein